MPHRHRQSATADMECSKLLLTDFFLWFALHEIRAYCRRSTVESLTPSLRPGMQNMIRVGEERKLLIFFRWNFSSSMFHELAKRRRRNKCFHWQKYRLMGNFSTLRTLNDDDDDLSAEEEVCEIHSNDVRFVQLMLCCLLQCATN